MTLRALLFLAAASLAAGQGSTISNMPAASTLGGTEVLPVVQSAANKKATVDQISTYTLGQAAGTFAPLNNPTFTGSSGTIPSGWSIGGYQPLAAKLTAFASLADAAGVFTSDGAGGYSWTAKTVGGNGATDSGKLAVFGTNGELAAQGYVRVTNGTTYTGIVTNGLTTNKNSNFCSLNWPSTPTSSRVATLPDATGTIYLIGQGLGTPSSATLTNATGLPISTGVSGLGTNVATALAVNVGSSGAFVVNGGALGTPSSGTLTNATGLPPAGVVGTAAILGANTFTGAQTISAAGAVSAPAFFMSGAPFTGGTSTTTKPLALLEASGATSTSWSTNGTFLGLNAASGFTGNLIDSKIDGTTYFSSSAAVMLMRAAEIRIANNSPLYFGPTTAVDIGFIRVNGTAMILNGVGGVAAWRVAGDGGGSGSTKWASFGHDGTNGVITTGSTGGNISLAKPLSIPSGSNARAGNATLVGGTVTVSNNTVTAATLVLLTRKTAGGTIGDLTYTLSAGTSFTITSANASDTSTVTYLLIENP